MQKILPLSLMISLFLIGSVSAYGIVLSCPTQITVGQALKCNISSDYPPGTSFDLVFYQAQYTSTEIARAPLVIQGTSAPIYKLFDTTGLKGGTYKVEVQFTGPHTDPRSNSTLGLIVQLIDRSGDITITSPVNQTLDNALLISGSIANEGNSGVQLKVTGENTGQVVFSQQYIRTSNTLGSGAGVFSQQVTVSKPDDYDAQFSDANGLIGTVTFHVISSVPFQTATRVPVTVQRTTTTAVTAAPTPVPTPTKSPVPVAVVLGALVICIVLTFGLRKKQQ
jgi:hypothetical protein